ncbi:unnamed protein product [Nesidiocoris tenuis]|uniref:Uncharacterized protein n=1 Tax=Nesidiocoris tenuis TaxID=355587 RepID=A0A6H5GIZ1_9HEMI|nr:unnamed protein product [Nesidiocoris tenuis]
MEQRVVKIDLLEYLVSNVGIFNKLDPASKRNIFNSRPQPMLSSLVDTVNGKRFVTPFSLKYYEDFPWMTACPKRQVLFCFVCLLQGHTVPSVICSKSDPVEAAQAHETTAVHLAAYDACLQCVQMPGPTACSERSKQLRVKRKRLLGKIVHVLYLLKCQAYFDKLGRDREFTYETIQFMALNDVSVSIDWDTLFPELKSNSALEASLFSTTRDLIFEHVKNELAAADFASMRIIDVSEYTAKPTFSIVLRYIANDEIVERFGGFYELVDYNSKIDVSSLLEILDYWDIRQKVIGISCDFHANRLPKSVPDRPFRLFNVTAAGHNLKYTAIKIAFSRKEIRDFLGRVQRAVGCLKLLNTDGLLPTDVAWIALTVDSTPVHNQIADLANNLSSVVETLSRLKKDANIGFHASLVAHTEKLLEDDQFAAYLNFFAGLFDVCDDFGRQDLEDLKERLWKLTAGSSDSFRPPDSKKPAIEGKLVSELVVEDVIADFEIRVKVMADYAVGQLFDHNLDREEAKDLKSLLDPVLKETKGLIDFDLPRLKTELQVLLKDPTKKLSAGELFETMTASKSLQVFAEFSKLLKFHMTLPMSTSGDNSIVVKIKDFARTTRCTAEAFKFDTLMVENRLTMKLMGDPVFMEYLIDSLSRVQPLSDLFQNA